MTRRVTVNLVARAATAQRRRDQTRERLIDAAETVVAEKGVETASIEDFVRAAGVSRGTFYNYFPTATDIVHAMNTRVSAVIDARLDALADDAQLDAASHLAATLHTILESFPSDPVRGWLSLQLAASRAPRQKPFEQRLTAIYQQGVAQGRFHDVEVNAVWTLVFGTLRMTQRDIAAGEAPPSQSVQVVALLLTALSLPLAEAERISRDKAAAARIIDRAG